MGAYSVNVAVRWSDMDVFGHVNNARVVTLLEEARTRLLFEEGARHGAEALADGLVVVDLEVRYRAPVFYSAEPVPVRMWVSELRSAWFALDYALGGTDDDSDIHGDGRAAVTARTRLAPYETGAKRPRRLSGAEREFLAGYQLDGQLRDPALDGAGGG